MLDLNSNIYCTNFFVSLPHRKKFDLEVSFYSQTVQVFRFTYILRHSIFTKSASISWTFPYLRWQPSHTSYAPSNISNPELYERRYLQSDCKFTEQCTLFAIMLTYSVLNVASVAKVRGCLYLVARTIAHSSVSQNNSVKALF